MSTMGTEAAVPVVDRVLVHRLAAFGVSNRDLNNSMFFYSIMMSVLVTLVLLYFTFQRSVHHSIVEESFPP